MDNPYKSPIIDPIPDSKADLGDVSDEQAAKRFRWLLALWIIVGLVGLPVTLVADSFLPPELLAYENGRAQQGLTTRDVVAFVIVVLVVPFLIWNLVQLFRLKASARLWAVILTIAGLPIFLLFGPAVESSVSEIWTEVTNIMWGILLAMMYCNPYAKQFD